MFGFDNFLFFYWLFYSDCFIMGIQGLAVKDSDLGLLVQM